MIGIEYLILISLDFCDFISPFSFQFKFWWRRYIKHERQCLTTFPNASEFVKNTPQHVLFSTLFSVLACGQTCSFSSGQIVIVSSSGTLVNSERTSKEPIYSPLWVVCPPKLPRAVFRVWYITLSTAYVTHLVFCFSSLQPYVTIKNSSKVLSKYTWRLSLI